MSANQSMAQRLGRVLEKVTRQSGRLPETPAYGSLLLGRVSESQRRRRIRIQVIMTVLVLGANLIGIGVALLLVTVAIPEPSVFEDAPAWITFGAAPAYIAVALALGTYWITRRLVATLRWAIEAHDGRLFKHTDDGVCAAFASPTSAVTERVEEAVRYSDAGRAAIETGRYHLPFGQVQWLGGAYLATGQPQWMVDLCREELRHHPDTHAAIRASLVVALAMAGSVDAAIATGTGLIDAAEAAGNPCTFSYALFAYGYASLGVQPAQARNALRQGLAIAQDSGNRSNEAHLAVALFRLEAEYGDALAALDYALLSIRSYHDSGNMNTICMPLAILATFLDRRGRFERRPPSTASLSTRLRRHPLPRSP